MKSAFDVAAPAAALFWAIVSDFAFLPVAFYALALAFLYFGESPERVRTRTSFWTVAALAPFAGGFAEGNALPAAMIAATFAAFAAALKGFSRFWYRRPVLAYGFVHIAALAALAAAFFRADFGVARSVGFAAALFLLFREFFAFRAVPWKGRALLVSAAAALVLFEIASAVRLLPLGFANAAAFFGLAALLARDAARAHFEGALTRGFVLRSVSVFLFLSVVIFGFSRWGL